MLVEEISLSATVEDLDPDLPAAEHEAMAQLDQVNHLRRSDAHFVLFNDHRLSVSSRGAMQKTRDFTLFTGILDPQPKRLTKICWRLLLLGVVLCAVTWLSVVHRPAAFWFLPVVPGICAVLSFIAAVYRSYDRVVFYSQSGRVPLVVMCNRLPDTESLAAFTDALAQDIKAARSLQVNDREALIDEMKAHRQLMEDGVISTKRYDIVKQRILSMHH